ncbi:unnamed protein product [Aphanomyces euteiches]|uniref:Peptidase M14 domain-containing protein n=1 Tax=Aphanomyces euteiches TaxID=100861 RepID=A0A6G0WBE4_9STRA|nr:hypothetical protein Ae201684_016646 [Aphanomyces euteiches]KAH9078567.1 hypothetical protein Ae201684P_019649 [Aphanomyces euteiches]
MKLSFLSCALVALVASADDDFVRGQDGRLRSIEQDATIRSDAVTNRQCQLKNTGYLSALKAGSYAKSTFHKCFHTTAQIYEFVDALVAQNPKLLSKFAISKTFKGQTIYGYKLTKGNSKSLYFQAVQHAREWVAGSSLLYSLSSILDDISAGKSTAADQFDIYFVPLVNLDGYDITWSSDRYRRTSANQVDLNRNWPTPYKNPEPPAVGDEIYPGTKPFSEPETSGINNWLQSKRNELAGFIDVHTYAGLILFPYGDTNSTIGNGYDAKFNTLGLGLKSVMGSGYAQQSSHQLYLAYGVFPDWAWRNFTKPALTIEIVGTDFVAAASTIPARGLEVYKGINQFAKEVVKFNGAMVAATVDEKNVVEAATVQVETATVREILD